VRHRSDSTQQLVAEAEALVGKRPARVSSRPADDTAQLIQDAEALVARSQSRSVPLAAACVVVGALAAAGVYLWLR
jgi:hypothetical protein